MDMHPVVGVGTGRQHLDTSSGLYRDFAEQLVGVSVAHLAGMPENKKHSGGHFAPS